MASVYGFHFPWHGFLSCRLRLAVCALHRGGLTGAFLALGGDALQQLGGGFVLRVLRDELAGKGVAKNGLAQRLRALQLRCKVAFEVLND